MLKPIIFLSLIFVTLAVRSTLYTYKTAHNISMQAIVFLPDTPPPPAKYPVIYAIHGGAFVTGYYMFTFTPQEFGEIMKRGWAIVSIDYLLSPHALFPDMLQDVHDGYRWIRKDLARTVAINPNHIVIWGGSSGATLVAIAASQLIPRPKAVILLYPFCMNFTDLFAYDPSTPVSKELATQADNLRQPLTEYVINSAPDARDELMKRAISEKKLGWLFMTSNPNEDPEDLLKLLHQYSTLENIDTNYPPTYIIHGLNDWVPVAQTLQLAQEFERKNIEHKVGLVPGGIHVFDGPEVSEIMWEQDFIPLFDFIEEHITRAPKSSNMIQNLSLAVVVLALILC